MKQPLPFRVETFDIHVQGGESRNRVVCQAVVKIVLDGRAHLAAAEADTPAEALNKAMYSALMSAYRAISVDLVMSKPPVVTEEWSHNAGRVCDFLAGKYADQIRGGKFGQGD
jgi:hypothetical protein